MKRAVCLVMVFILLWGMALPAAAASSKVKLSEINEHAFSNYEGHAAIHPEDTLPDDEIIIPLLKDGFYGEDGNQVVWSTKDPTLGPSLSQARASLRVYFKMMVGRDVIRDIDFVKYTPTPRVRAQSAIRIRFIEDYDSTKELVYRFKVRMVAKGTTIGIEEVFGGTMYNLEYDTEGALYTELGYKAIWYTGDESVDRVVMDLGEGVSVTTDMFKGEKYYGYAKLEPNEGQDAVLEAYPEIYDVYRIKTINIKSYGSKVQFYDRGDDVFYVYNERGEFVGMSNEDVAYSTTFYLSPSPLKINMDLLPEQLPAEEEEKEPTNAALLRFLRQGKSE